MQISRHPQRKAGFTLAGMVLGLLVLPQVASAHAPSGSIHTGYEAWLHAWSGWDHLLTAVAAGWFVASCRAVTSTGRWVLGMALILTMVASHAGAFTGAFFWVWAGMLLGMMAVAAIAYGVQRGSVTSLAWRVAMQRAAMGLGALVLASFL